MLHLNAPRSALFQDLLEQDAFMSHVLIDDPKAVPSGGDDETLVNLPEWTQVRKDRKRHLRRRDRFRWKLAMSIGTAQQFTGGWRARRYFDGRRAEIQARGGSRGGAQSEIRKRGLGWLGDLDSGCRRDFVFQHLAEFGIREPCSRLCGIGRPRRG